MAVRPAAAAVLGPHAAARRPSEAGPAARQEVAAAQAAPSAAEVAPDAPLGAVRAGPWVAAVPVVPWRRAEVQPEAAELARPVAVAAAPVSPRPVEELAARRAWPPPAAERTAAPEAWTAPVLPPVAVEASRA